MILFVRCFLFVYVMHFCFFGWRGSFIYLSIYCSVTHLSSPYLSSISLSLFYLPFFLRSAIKFKAEPALNHSICPSLRVWLTLTS